AGTLAETPFPPVAGYPTARWAAGDLFVGHRRLLLPPDVRGGQLDLELGVRGPGGEWLGAPGDLAPLAKLADLPVRERPASFDPPAGAQAIDARLAGDVRLLAYDVDAANARPGGSVRLTLYW